MCPKPSPTPRVFQIPTTVLCFFLCWFRIVISHPNLPVLTARRLQNLVHVLSTSEIRRLRDQLNNIRLSVDIFTKIPVELLLHVADHLNLEDVIKARCVSRTWNQLFSSPDFCIGVIKKHFQLVWQNQLFSMNPTEHSDAKARLQKWFQNAALARIRRQHGQYSSMAVYRYHFEDLRNDPLRHPEDPLEERKYCNGRVAFRKSPYSFIVKSLRSNDTWTLMTENRTPMAHRWWISDRYLFAQSKHP